MTQTPVQTDGPDPWGTYQLQPVLDAPGYTTAGGARTEVTGPDSSVAYRMPCTGCGTDENTGDVPPAVAETVAHSSARYHAKHCRQPFMNPAHPRLRAAAVAGHDLPLGIDLSA